jgi:CheY-like chemotaxis protein
MHVLIVEDVETKLADVRALAEALLPDDSLFKIATNLNDAEDAIMEKTWDLVILDLSMDISRCGSVGFSGGHAALAGLDVLERMSLFKLDPPTILVTGFDSFQDIDRFDNAIMNRADIDALAAEYLGSAYLGCVRYGANDWERQFTQRIVKWRGK